MIWYYFYDISAKLNMYKFSKLHCDSQKTPTQSFHRKSKVDWFSKFFHCQISFTEPGQEQINDVEEEIKGDWPTQIHWKNGR